MWLSNVHTWLKPNVSALVARSTTRALGGGVCNTTPMSMLVPFRLHEVLRQLSLDEAAVSRSADVGVVLDHDRAAREHGVDLAVDHEPLVRGVVHVHVVLVVDADRGAAVRIPHDHVGVGARGNDALAWVHAEHARRRRATRLDP